MKNDLISLGWRRGFLCGIVSATGLLWIFLWILR